MNNSSASSMEALQDRVRFALDLAVKKGATSAVADVSDESGLNINVRNQEIETIEHTRERSFGVTVYIGQCRGNASTGDLSDKSVEQTVQAAVDIARFTAEDPFAGLPDKALLCTEFPDLSLCHPWNLTAEQAVALCAESERAGMESDGRIVNSEGCNLSSTQGRFVLGNTLGFCAGFDFSNHSVYTSLIAEDASGMQVGGWYTMGVSPEQLEDAQTVGRKAARRAYEMLSARTVSTRKCPVVFESQAAKGLIRCLISAVSGRNLYNKSTFLPDHLGKAVLPAYLSLREDPFVKAAYGSAPFDDEGVRPSQRFVVNQGILEGYFLSSYSARKLGMTSTGNAGGPYNLYLETDVAHKAASLDALLKRMGTGLLVTSLIGQGVNPITGDYSRGAKGFWVENGEIAYAVDGLTVAGNLKDMLMSIEAIADDNIDNSEINCGSILLSNMTVAGS